MTAPPPRDFGFGEDGQATARSRPSLPRRASARGTPARAGRSRSRGHLSARRAARVGREGIWKQIGELGWAGLAVPEAAGGVGGKMVGIAALIEEVGRHALPSPLVATLCAAFALRASRTPEADACLARIADGAAASLAITDERGSWNSAPSAATAPRRSATSGAQRSGGRWSGTRTRRPRSARRTAPVRTSPGAVRRSSRSLRGTGCTSTSRRSPPTSGRPRSTVWSPWGRRPRHRPGRRRRRRGGHGRSRRQRALRSSPP